MKLVSTEIEKESPRNASVVVAPDSTSSGPEYEYGLRVSLSNDVIGRLGLDMRSLSVGQEIKLAGVGKIVGVSESEYSDGKERSVSIQLVEVGVEPKSEAADEFDKVFGE